jgi:tRNA(fMet)-specific endonuclease VapC
VSRFLLDTNTVSMLLRANPAVVKHVVAAPMGSLCVSAVTEGELRFGLARRPDAKKMHHAVGELLRRVDVLPWDSATAICYGRIRADLERAGRSLSPLDLMIAAHAMDVVAILVTNDAAFANVSGLQIEDWSRD